MAILFCFVFAGLFVCLFVCLFLSVNYQLYPPKVSTSMSFNIAQGHLSFKSTFLLLHRSRTVPGGKKRQNCLQLGILEKITIFTYNLQNFSSQMKARSAAKHFLYICLSQIVLVWCCVASSGVVCPEKCSCKPFGSKRFIVKCKGITQVSLGLPLNTAMLWVHCARLHTRQKLWKALFTDNLTHLHYDTIRRRPEANFGLFCNCLL